MGVANVVPVVFSAGHGRPAYRRASAWPSVATIGYFGFLFAPPILGFIGNEYGLSASLGLVVLMGLAIAWLSYRQL